MSAFSDGLIEDVRVTVESQWASRKGQVVPDTEDVRLGNDRVELNAVLLYADLADSTELAIGHQVVAAEVFKCYLRGVTKIIENLGGSVRSFDGDRVMGVFLGDHMNSNAAKCALQINWFFKNVVTPKFRQHYGQTIDGVNFDQTVGVDGSSVHVARSGVRNNNDLIWVGRAPNIAAKLSALRSPKYKTFITPGVYGVLQETSKFGGEPRRDMWTLLDWKAGIPYGVPQVYGSNFIWPL